MKRADAHKAYQDLSDRASQNVRQLGIAALAVIWIFHPSDSPDLRFPTVLLKAGCFAVAALAADFLQYAYGTAAWGLLHRKKELAGVAPDEDFKAPRSINWPSTLLFWLKTLAIVVTYIYLLIYFAQALRAG